MVPVATSEAIRTAPEMIKGEAFGWKALCKPLPSGRWNLSITGSCRFPSPGYSIELRPATLHPGHQETYELERIVTEPSTAQPPRRTVEKITYSKEVETFYPEVHISPDDVSISVALDRDRTPIYRADLTFSLTEGYRAVEAATDMQKLSLIQTFWTGYESAPSGSTPQISATDMNVLTAVATDMKDLLRNKAVAHATFLNDIITRNPDLFEEKITAEFEASDLAIDVKRDLLERARRGGGITHLLQETVSRITPEAVSAEINSINRQLLQLESQIIQPQLVIKRTWQCWLKGGTAAGLIVAAAITKIPTVALGAVYAVQSYLENCVVP